MENYTTDSHFRSILKGISWRIIATSDTILIVLLITCITGDCNVENAFKIGISEFIIKLGIYYFHERIWVLVLKKQATTNREVLTKTISWRIIATTTTFIISGVVLEAFNEIALYIAISELVTKLGLYYFHERIWLKLPLGKIRSMFFNRK